MGILKLKHLMQKERASQQNTNLNSHASIAKAYSTTLRNAPSHVDSVGRGAIL